MLSSFFNPPMKKLCQPTQRPPDASLMPSDVAGRFLGEQPPAMKKRDLGTMDLTAICLGKL